MKKIYVIIIGVLLLVILGGCSNNKEPQVRIRNEGADKINVTIQFAAEKKINLSDIEAGKTTDYKVVSAGNITATDLTRNESVSFLAENKASYTVVMGLGKAPSVNMDK